MFKSFSGKYSSPSGTSSDTFDAYPSTSPSLYTLIVYTTTSPFTTSNGSFECSYVILLFSLSYLTCGILEVTSLSLMFVINFLNAKSNFLTTTLSKSSSSS